MNLLQSYGFLLSQSRMDTTDNLVDFQFKPIVHSRQQGGFFIYLLMKALEYYQNASNYRWTFQYKRYYEQLRSRRGGQNKRSLLEAS